MIGETAAVVAFLAVICSPFYKPIMHRATVLGAIGRPESTWSNIHGEGMRVIPNTVGCEDIHLHSESGLLFAACQGELENRPKWFPPMGAFDLAGAQSQGSLVVIDPKTFKTTHLTLTGFDGPFITHGIDVITGEDPATVYIYAVNHLVNTSHTPSPSSPPHLAARSQIEIFRHVLGTSTAEYLRSVRHTLIVTPNDIVATSPTTFFVTNDHHYRSGMMRSIEALLTEYLGGWSNTIHVQLTDRSPPDAEAGIIATEALTGLHNNNGLGHADPGRSKEILVTDASGGVLYRARRLPDETAPGTERLEVVERIYIDSTIDNPSWYEDPYASTGQDASGYVIAGLAHAVKLAGAFPTLEQPVSSIVWHVRAPEQGAGSLHHSTWEKRVVFQDDSSTLRSATAAVMVGIDPQKNGGRKQAWLFTTGFLGKGVVATKVDL